MAELLNMGRRLPEAFLRWWLEELHGLLPQALVRSSPAAKASLIVRLGQDHAILLESTPRHGERELDRISSDAIEGNGFSPAAFGDRRFKNWPVLIQLTNDLGMRKVVELPLAAREDLNQVLHFELDRLTPFKADDVRFNWRILDSDESRLRVELEMAPTSIIDRAMALVQRHGRDIERIELEGGPSETPLDLMPRLIETKSQGSWLGRILPLIALALAIAAVSLPLSRQQGLLDRIQEDITIVRAEAEESLAIREELDTLAERARFLATTKNGRPTMTEILAELTRALPDQSHILQLQIRDNEVELNGLAERASDLIAILDQSPLLTSPQFRSPVTRDPRASKERFQISVSVVERSP